MPAHDPAQRRRGLRKQRERGVWIYVPLAELEKTDVVDAEDGGAPFYRVWTRRRAVLVQLYAKP